MLRTDLVYGAASHHAFRHRDWKWQAAGWVFICLLLTACSGSGAAATPQGGAPATSSETPPHSVNQEGPLIITEQDRGRTLHLSPGRPAFLRLSGGPLWDEPAVEGTAIELVRVYYESDPGFEEWAVHAVTPGLGTISTTAWPNPPGPGAKPLLKVEITIEVAG